MSSSKKIYWIIFLLAFVFAILLFVNTKVGAVANKSFDVKTESSSVENNQIQTSNIQAMDFSASENQESKPAVAKQKSMLINKKLEDRYKTLSDNDNYPTLESRLQAMSDRTNKSYEPEAVLDAMAARSIWASSATPPKDMHLNEVELHDGREFIAVNRMKIESLLPGDSLPLPISQIHSDVDIKIISVDKNPNGSFTWHGEIKQNNDIYFAQVTQSDVLTMAGMSTPNGNFTLQANGVEGWLAKTDTLFKRNPQISDAPIPGE